MLTPIPHEIAIGGVYIPPMLVAALFGIIGALADDAPAQSLPLVEVLFLSAGGVAGVDGHLYRLYRHVYYWGLASE